MSLHIIQSASLIVLKTLLEITKSHMIVLTARVINPDLSDSVDNLLEASI